jgi:hypothetical protein
MKSFCGVQGQFLQKEPLVAEGMNKKYRGENERTVIE